MSTDHDATPAGAASPGAEIMPTVVCLCGSTRFYDAFQRANYEETMAGKIVLSVGFYPHSQEQAHGEEVGCTPEQKAALDDLHLAKIRLSDECLFLNVNDYLGESSRRELAYARSIGKPVRFLVTPTQHEATASPRGEAGEACPHASMHGTDDPAVWVCDACGMVRREVPDPDGSVSVGLGKRVRYEEVATDGA